jgi:hypothetical protein
MMRRTKTITLCVVASAALLGRAAHAQTTTTVTTTTTTTTTTLLPHPFSPATRECIRAAKLAYRSCPGTQDDCLKTYQDAYSKCFAAGAGVKCAAKCESTLTKCLSAVPTTRKTCRKTCRTNRKRDTKACRLIPVGDTIWAGGDGGCLTTSDTSFRACNVQCSEARQVCQTSFTFCIADCPNL